MSLAFSKTYLYKLHKLTNSLDKVFDQVLRNYAGLGLSQFILLLSIAEHEPVSQCQIAHFLEVSPGAISRRVELAKKNGLLKIQGNTKDRRGQILQLTPKGKHTINLGLKVLDKHVLQIFDSHDNNASLMNHVDALLNQIKEVDAKHKS